MPAYISKLYNLALWLLKNDASDPNLPSHRNACRQEQNSSHKLSPELDDVPMLCPLKCSYQTLLERFNCGRQQLCRLRTWCLRVSIELSERLLYKWLTRIGGTRARQARHVLGVLHSPVPTLCLHDPKSDHLLKLCTLGPWILILIQALGWI